MKSIALLTALGLAACSTSSDSFEVQVADSSATGAVLRLCGSEFPLSQTRDGFRGRRRTSCEGTGEIRVSFTNRQTVSCAVGYVTPGLGQNFEFVVRDGRCVEVLKKRQSAS